jgi:biopolymer transport protein ExbD
MHRRLARTAVTILIASSLLIGCRSRGSITNDTPKAERLAAPADTLPPIKSGVPMTRAQISVTVTKTTVSVGENIVAPLPSETAWAHGIDVKYKRSGPNDLYIVPLANAAQSAQDWFDAAAKPHEARIAADGAIPYRVLVEVLYTLGQSEFDAFKLVAPSAGGRVPKDAASEIVVHPPRMKTAQLAMLRSQADAMQLEMLRALQGDAAAPAPAQPRELRAPPPTPDDRPTLGLTVIIVNDGISLKARGGNVAPGCNDVGAGLSIPKAADGRQDIAALAACIVKLKAAAPEFKDEREVTVSANPEIPYSTVLQVVDAVRGENADVLPDVMFGVAR